MGFPEKDVFMVSVKMLAYSANIPMDSPEATKRSESLARHFDRAKWRNP